MRTYLIKYKQGENSSVIDDRIKNSGSYFALSECEFLVTTDFLTLSIFITAIDGSVDTGYWGVSKNDLWDWLRDHGISR